MNSKELVAQMTLEEKASLCSGRDFWNLKGIERLGLPPIMVTDGPHGLRKQAGDADHLGINRSVPATCFPAACATSSSFDRQLLREVGAAIGEECRQENVAVVLGPGANIKRSPLCGRNFEYISEDPYVSGQLSIAMIEGIQSQKIGTSMKHYAANNQEKCRMTSNSVVDARALREIYLTAFEHAVKQSQPWTLMCSYNRLNGEYASQNPWLLTQVLRDEWGFEGLVMTDWGATDDRVKGVQAGLDLEMPASGGYNDAKIVEAVKQGKLPEQALDRVVERIVGLILKSTGQDNSGYRYDPEAHHALARRAAAESCVLLKNEGDVLPLAAGAEVAVLGGFAVTPRYQGAGSSKINPTRMDNPLEELQKLGLQVAYQEGYSLARGSGPEPEKITAAAALAKGKAAAVVFAGLPDEYESEGFDRSTMAMPESHNQLIEAVAEANPNTIVVLQLGAPVEMPWLSRVKAVVVAYLGGQAGGGGTADVLAGRVNPGGRLAETWPITLKDTPTHGCFPAAGRNAEYRESIFVGYRYYDRVEKPVAFPFGFGLSYTSFSYSGLQVQEGTVLPEKGTKVSFRVTNTGKTPGAEVPQLYLARAQGDVPRPVRELKGFEKVMLQPGESKTVSVLLDYRSFAYYNTAEEGWAVEGGEYRVQVGSSSRDIRLEAPIQVQGDGKEEKLAFLKQTAPAYFNLPRGDFAMEEAQFAALYGQPLPPQQRQPDEPFTQNSTLNDIKDTLVGKQILKMMQKRAEKVMAEGGADMEAMVRAILMDAPLRSMVMMSGGEFSPKQLDGMVDLLNGKPFKGMAEMLGK